MTREEMQKRYEKEIRDMGVKNGKIIHELITDKERQSSVIKKLLEVVGFYGDANNWCSWDVSREDNKPWHITIADDEFFIDDYIQGEDRKIYRRYVGGKKAREALEKIKGE